MVVVVVGGLPGANLATRVPEGVAERDLNLDVSLCYVTLAKAAK